MGRERARRMEHILQVPREDILGQEHRGMGPAVETRGKRQEPRQDTRQLGDTRRLGDTRHVEHPDTRLLVGRPLEADMRQEHRELGDTRPVEDNPGTPAGAGTRQVDTRAHQQGIRGLRADRAGHDEFL